MKNQEKLRNTKKKRRNLKKKLRNKEENPRKTKKKEENRIIFENLVRSCCSAKLGNFKIINVKDYTVFF